VNSNTEAGDEAAKEEFAKLLRQRLEARHNSSTYIRTVLSRFTDAELIDAYLQHERTLLEHLTKIQAEQGD
jgi:hypothetical protein